MKIKSLSCLVVYLLLLISAGANALEEGQTAPQCPAVLADSNQALDLTAYKGKVVLIDFWASWCGPCQKSMPFLNSLRNELHKDGFEVIAINVDENSDEARQFLLEQPVDYKVAFDPNAECPRRFDVKAMPSSYFIDKSGKVRKIHLGFRDSDQAEMLAFISKLLAE